SPISPGGFGAKGNVDQSSSAPKAPAGQTRWQAEGFLTSRGGKQPTSTSIKEAAERPVAEIPTSPLRLRPSLQTPKPPPMRSVEAAASAPSSRRHMPKASARSSTARSKEPAQTQGLTARPPSDKKLPEDPGLAGPEWKY